MRSCLALLISNAETTIVYRLTRMPYFLLWRGHRGDEGEMNLLVVRYTGVMLLHKRYGFEKSFSCESVPSRKPLKSIIFDTPLLHKIFCWQYTFAFSVILLCIIWISYFAFYHAVCKEVLLNNGKSELNTIKEAKYGNALVHWSTVKVSDSGK